MKEKIYSLEIWQLYEKTIHSSISHSFLPFLPILPIPPSFLPFPFSSFFFLYLKVMERDGKKIRDEGPIIFAQVKANVGVPEIAAHILQAYERTVPK